MKSGMIACLGILALTLTGCGGGKASPTGPSGSGTSSAQRPQLTSVDSTTAAQGSAVSLVIQGSNLTGGHLEISPATGIGINNPQASATQVTAQLAIAADAATGSRQLTVATAGGASNALGFTITLPAPSNVRYGGSGTFLFVTWTATPGATAYVLELGTTPGTTSITRETQLTSIGIVLTPGTYYARVRARDAAGLGPPSPEVTVRA